MAPVPTPNPDVLTGTPLADEIGGFDGNDSVLAGDGDDRIIEGIAIWRGPDQTLPGAGTPYLVRGRAYDFGDGDDRISGGAGLDTLSYRGLVAPLRIDLVQRTVVAANGTDSYSGIERIEATTGDDRATGAVRGMMLDLGDGQDRAGPFGDGSVYSGGGGVDLLDLGSATTAVQVDLASGAAAIGDSAGQMTGFEQVRGSKTAANVLTGSAAANLLVGGAADDTLAGGSGHDNLSGGGGDDTVDGGAGDDAISTGSGEDVISDLSGTAQIDAGSGADMIRFIGGAADGGSGNDSFLVIGNGLAIGGSGLDRFLVASASSAVALGGDGDDRFELSGVGFFQGGIHGGAGTDLLLLLGAAGLRVTAARGDVPLSEQRTVVTGVEVIRSDVGGVDIALESGGTTVELAKGNNRITVGAVSATIMLGGGDDSVTLARSHGSRVLTGGGDDTITVDDGGSGLAISAQSGDDRLLLSGSAAVDMGAGNDSVFVQASATPGATDIRMGDGDDQVLAFGAFGSVDLGAGADLLRFFEGGVPSGPVLGGAGADSFDFQLTSRAGTFELSDFSASDDRIGLAALGVATLGDFTSVTQRGDDVHLFVASGVAGAPAGQGLRIILADTLIGAVTDALLF